MLFYNCKITKIGQCLTHMNSLQQYAIFLTLSCTHTHLHAGSHHTWCWSRKENVEITSLLLKGAFCKQCILAFWCSSLKKAKSFILNVVFFLFLSSAGYKERSLYPNPSGSSRQRRLCWQPEFTHGKKHTMWVLFADWLWKQVSWEQSCLSPAALRGFLVCPQVL